MSAVDVEDICETIFQHSPDGVIIGQIVMLLKVSVLIKVNGGEVGGEYMEINGLAVVLGCGGDVVL